MFLVQAMESTANEGFSIGNNGVQPVQMIRVLFWIKLDPLDSKSFVFQGLVGAEAIRVNSGSCFLARPRQSFSAFHR
jgi:hypothetical protein